MSDIHDEIDATITRADLRVTLHALASAGVFTVLECTYTSCDLTTRKFFGASKSPGSLTIDHIVSRYEGGSDRIENIQLLHHRCNMRKGAMFDRERRARISASVKRRWQDPIERAKFMAQAVAAATSPTANAKRSESMRRHWADPQRRAAHTASLVRGDEWKKVRQDGRSAARRS